MRHLIGSIFVIALLAAPGGNAQAQETVASPAVPAADPSDVKSIDAILLALYDVISGGAGEARDWGRMRSLFVPGALLVPAAPRPDGTAPLRPLSLEDWIRGAESFFAQNPFYERELDRDLDQFGNVANAMSTYGSYREPEGEPFARGINTITLVSDGTRWYVVSIAWDVHREGNPLAE